MDPAILATLFCKNNQNGAVIDPKIAPFLGVSINEISTLPNYVHKQFIEEKESKSGIKKREIDFQSELSHLIVHKNLKHEKNSQKFTKINSSPQKYSVEDPKTA